VRRIAIYLAALAIGLVTLPGCIRSPVATTSEAGQAGQAGEVAIVINEVEQNPPGTDAGNEWVELYNPTSVSILLTGWTLSTTHGRTVTIHLSGSIDPHEYKVIGYWKQWLDNEDEQVVLKDNKRRIVDQTPILTDTKNDERS